MTTEPSDRPSRARLLHHRLQESYNCKFLLNINNYPSDTNDDTPGYD